MPDSNFDEDDDLAELREINVTPFIDVLLVLLVIFMVTVPIATQQVPVDLPTVAAASLPPEETPIAVTLQTGGTLSVDGTPSSLESLRGALEQASGGDHTRRIILRADKTILYQQLMDVMGALRNAGFARLALVGKSDGSRTP